MKKRILFLISDTGGGHRASARAIEEAIHHLYPEMYETVIEDIWQGHTPWPINKIPAAYPWMTGRGEPLWKLMWYFSTRMRPHKVVFPTVSPVIKRRVTRYLITSQADIVVSVHPLTNHLPYALLRKAGLQTPFVTVVTDMVTVHPTWICPEVTFCLVPTEPARRLALQFGLAAEKVVVAGQPVSLKFAAGMADKGALRQKLGLTLDCRTVLLVGGGEGVGRIFEIARAIATTVPQAQLLVVTGRNRVLKEQLETVCWEIPTHIYGFVDNMDELMGAADILVTKAGPGTISEAFVAGLPLILFDYIPGQEAGNVAYVREHDAGAFAQEPAEIARLVSEWMNPEHNRLQEMARNAAALARPEAALTIARKVCELI